MATNKERIAKLEAEVLMMRKMMYTMFESINAHGGFDGLVVAELRPLYMSVRSQAILDELEVKTGKSMDDVMEAGK